MASIAQKKTFDVVYASIGAVKHLECGPRIARFNR